ncbi:DNA ligase [Rubritalea spongiae]|uniref:DNA ligase n=1 Tax=Rubritalea spongiae TaxID=430797 RepID=A0ABW5E158_9BACT
MRLVLAISFFFSLVPFSGAQSLAPSLQRAQSYDDSQTIDIADYWISEKLDGVRGYWDGKQLLTRSGRNIPAPAWFTAAFPKDTVLDGELWIARESFDQVSGIIRTQQANDDDWKKVQYHIFDLPKHGGNLDQRVLAIRKLVAKNSCPWLKAVKQFKVQSETELHQYLQQLVNDGGEGLMLHKGSATYQTQRTNDLLKLKPHQDAEAVVIGHAPGKGKYTGMLGALIVQLPDGRQLKLGSGFSDAQRKYPPTLGSTVTYQYTGLTATGLPRFPRFLRIREEQ